jgi:hypothetical protein
LLVDDVPDDVLCEADAAAGSATAMTTAAAALAAPAPAVAAASLVFPRRRDRWARARASSADSRSGVMVAPRFHGDEIVDGHHQASASKIRTRCAKLQRPVRITETSKSAAETQKKPAPSGPR